MNIGLVRNKSKTLELSNTNHFQNAYCSPATHKEKTKDYNINIYDIDIKTP